MTEDDFREQLARRGYGDPELTEYQPDADGRFHAHDFSAMLLVTAGEFRLVLEDETEVFGVGDWCEVPAGTVHFEQSGSDGASILAAKK
ncbi:MAG: cupin domain-containing protein [Acidimicrobiia bacterium]|nr:cupin domain-containing protein [Acidimicrobiia bacterium]